MTRRSSLSSAIVGVLMVAATCLAGCSTSTTVTSDKRTIQVVQHTVTLSIAPGQTAAGTASCASGEVLLSGGYFTTDVPPTDQDQDYYLDGVEDNYPSDSAGNPPSSQGQVEDSWTVRVHNSTTVQNTYFVSVNCASGYPITTAVWFQLVPPLEGLGSNGAADCPSSPENVLVGGGYSFAPYVLSFTYLGPTSTTRWDELSFGLAVPGTMFAVCAKGVYAEPFVTQQNYANLPISDQPPGPNPPLYGLTGVSCPNNDVLVGGGLREEDIDFFGTHVSVNTLMLGDAPQWRVGLNDGSSSSDFPPDYTYGICVALKWDGKVPITFSNYHHLLRIPADNVVVATDGSGQIKANETSVRVTGVQSNSIDATKTINPFTGGVSYSVPSGCGSSTQVVDAATSALKIKLKGVHPAGQVTFGSPTITIDRSSLTCSPTAGTQRSTPFTYTQMIDGSATQPSYDPSSIVKYQHAQLQKATQALGSPYVLSETFICPQGPKLVSATSTRATLQCSANGVAEWPWSTDQLQTLARALAGKSKADALQLLNTTPGIDAGSAVIDLPQGNTLPSDASAITIIVVRS